MLKKGTVLQYVLIVITLVIKSAFTKIMTVYYFFFLIIYRKI